MTFDAERLEVKIEADTRPFADAIGELGKLSDAFGRQLVGALRDAALSGRALEDVLKRIALNLAGMALNQALQPLTNLASGLFTGLLGGRARVLPVANGGVVSGGVTPFASGGVVAAPTYFPMARTTGLMGEAGAEAILPLRRGADGRLGVAAGGGSPVNVVFNVTAQDVASFRKSEGQITGMLARAVSRGSRTF